MQNQHTIHSGRRGSAFHLRPNDPLVLVELDLCQVHLQQVHNVDRPIQRHFLPAANRMRWVLHIQSTFDETGLARIFFSHHRDRDFGETAPRILSITSTLALDFLVLPHSSAHNIPTPLDTKYVILHCHCKPYLLGESSVPCFGDLIVCMFRPSSWLARSFEVLETWGGGRFIPHGWSLGRAWLCGWCIGLPAEVLGGHRLSGQKIVHGAHGNPTKPGDAHSDYCVSSETTPGVSIV